MVSVLFSSTVFDKDIFSSFLMFSPRSTQEKKHNTLECCFIIDIEIKTQIESNNDTFFMCNTIQLLALKRTNVTVFMKW